MSPGVLAHPPSTTYPLYVLAPVCEKSYTAPFVLDSHLPASDRLAFAAAVAFRLLPATAGTAVVLSPARTVIATRRIAKDRGHDSLLVMIPPTTAPPRR